MSKLRNGESVNLSNRAGVSDPISFAQFLESIKVGALNSFSPEEKPVVKIAGRFMGQRGPFAQLQDSSGRLQLYIGKKELGDDDESKEKYKQLVKLLDIGDFIAVEGFLFGTGTGEISLPCQNIEVFE